MLSLDLGHRAFRTAEAVGAKVTLLRLLKSVGFWRQHFCFRWSYSVLVGTTGFDKGFHFKLQESCRILENCWSRWPRLPNSALSLTESPISLITSQGDRAREQKSGRHALCHELPRLRWRHLSSHRLPILCWKAACFLSWFWYPPRAPTIKVSQISQDFQLSLPVPKPHFDAF